MTKVEVVIIDKSGNCLTKKLDMKKMGEMKLSRQTEWKKNGIVMVLFGSTLMPKKLPANENKFEFPPPVDSTLFFGNCIVAAYRNGVSINFTTEMWEVSYEELMEGFENLDDTKMEDDEEEEEEDDEEEEEEDDEEEDDVDDEEEDDVDDEDEDEDEDEDDDVDDEDEDEDEDDDEDDDDDENDDDEEEEEGDDEEEEDDDEENDDEDDEDEKEKEDAEVVVHNNDKGIKDTDVVNQVCEGEVSIVDVKVAFDELDEESFVK